MAELLKIVDLENGLKLKLYDRSRKLAGDRWLVALVACIDIPVDAFLEVSSAETALRPERIKAALGESIRFEQTMRRHFIDAAEKQEMLQDLMVSFLSSAVKYLSHTQFPSNYLLRTYQKYCEERRRQLQTKN